MTVRSVLGQPHLVSPLTLPPATGRPICVSPGLAPNTHWLAGGSGGNLTRQPTGQNSLALLHYCTLHCGAITIQGMLDIKHTQTIINH